MKNPILRYAQTLQHYCSKVEEVSSLVLQAWCEQHRYWHSLRVHLLQLLSEIDTKKNSFQEQMYHALVMLSLFHNVVFDPKRSDNYKRSAEVFVTLCDKRDAPYYDEIIEAILAINEDRFDVNEVAEEFYYLDKSLFINPLDFRVLIEYERMIFREQQYLDFKTYTTRRIRWLDRWRRRHPEHHSVADQLESYIRTHEPKIGVYVGSFDPFHKGHFSVLKKAERLFDKVIIAIGVNPKKMDQDTIEARLDEVRYFLPYHQVEAFMGFFTDYLKGLGYPTTVVRGIRNTTDLNQEIALQRVFEEQMPDINVVYFFSEHKVQHISSTFVRNFRNIKAGSERIFLTEPSRSIYTILGLDKSISKSSTLEEPRSLGHKS